MEQPQAYVTIRESSFQLDELREIQGKVSTMTVVTYLPVQFNIRAIIETLEPSELEIALIVCGQGNVRVHPAHRGLVDPDKRYKNFQNSITCMVRVEGGRFLNTKLFSNGTLHTTGCKTAADLNSSVNQILRHLGRASAQPGAPEFMRLLVDRDTLLHMPIDCRTATINVDLRFRFKIVLERLDEILKRMGVKSDYDQENHQGVNIHYCDGSEKIASIIVFGSGSTKINASSPVKVYRAFQFIKEVVKKNRAVVENERSLLDQIIDEDGLRSV